jgi:hypothetical protein
MLRANYLKGPRKHRQDLTDEQIAQEDEAANHMTHIMKKMHNHQRFQAPMRKVGT